MQNADVETYFVFDDAPDREWTQPPHRFFPCPGEPERGGLGLEVAARGFQWSHPLAQDVIFWVYEITNECGVDYDDVVFAQYIDWGVGGTDDSGDDEGAYNTRLDLAFAYDYDGIGSPGQWSPVGTAGYAFLESPGNSHRRARQRRGRHHRRAPRQRPRPTHRGRRRHPRRRRRALQRRRLRALLRRPRQHRRRTRPAGWWTGDENMNWQRLLRPQRERLLGPRRAAQRRRRRGRPRAGGPQLPRPRRGRGRRPPHRRRAQLRLARQGRVRPDRPHRLQGLRRPRLRTHRRRAELRRLPRGAAAASTSSSKAAATSGCSSPAAPSRWRRARPSASRWRSSSPTATSRDPREIDNSSLARKKQTVQQIYNANYRFARPPDKPTLTATPGDGAGDADVGQPRRAILRPLPARVRLRGLPDLPLDRAQLPASNLTRH